MKKTTQLLAAAQVLTSSYAYLPLDVSSLGSLGVNMRNQVTFHFVRASGSTITFAPEEYFSYKNSAGTEQIGWLPLMEDDGAGNLSSQELTCTEDGLSFSFSTTADNVRVGVKGTGTFAVYVTVAKVS